MKSSNQGSGSGKSRGRHGVRTPSQVFSCCPYCESHDLFKFEGQAFCNGCGWNSIAAFEHAIDLALERAMQSLPDLSGVVHINTFQGHTVTRKKGELFIA